MLANLPYVADGERAALAPEILRHEPSEALFAGADGLEVIRALLAQLARRPRVRTGRAGGGRRAGGQPSASSRAGPASAGRSSARDLAGIERVVVADRGAS